MHDEGTTMSDVILYGTFLLIVTLIVMKLMDAC